ncbi:unnamed protein product [Nippostrongylus brasiliensis]|uniref:SpoU_methylase domain-containing protein n=1 Tax=Nippostrongylus brasiliensis TaxID=27835 RepID=A0A0N4YN33_NIPBR|nr:unnamed protein product [Nippostrongylus brasiliensis]
MGHRGFVKSRVLAKSEEPTGNSYCRFPNPAARNYFDEMAPVNGIRELSEQQLREAQALRDNFRDEVSKRMGELLLRDTTSDGVTPGNSLLSSEEQPSPLNVSASTFTGCDAALMAIDRKLKWASEKINHSENPSEIRELFALVNEGLNIIKSAKNGPSLPSHYKEMVTLTNFRPSVSSRTFAAMTDGVTEKRRPNLDTVRSRSKDDERIASILDHARILGLPVKRLTSSQFDKITDFQLHNGVCLDASPLIFARDVSDSQLTSIFLDKVLDPGNLGAIARSALFFGCGQIAFAEGRGPSRITPAMSKASCGALETFRITCVPSFDSFYSFIGTADPQAGRKYGKPQVELEKLELQRDEKIVVVLGDEGLGVSDDVMRKCDMLLSIKSAGLKRTSVNSLNVSVVAGILLHHIAVARQH